MDRLDRRLQEVCEKRARRGRLQAVLGRADRDLADQKKRLAELEARQAKETKDVEKLEGLSLTALFHTLLSSKEEQLKKERQELLRARLRFDECREATAELEEQVAGMRRELAGLGGVEEEYDRLIARKERELLGERGNAARELMGLAERIGEERAQLREQEEALACGRAALASLDRVIASLGSARNWGTWDMLGGGLLSTAIKHSKIDQGRRAAHDAQRHLRRFQSELADVRIREDLRVDIGGFDTFADYFFDGLIFDWVVQSKIVRSLEGAARTRARAAQTLEALRDLQLVTERRLAELEEARRRAIEDA